MPPQFGLLRLSRRLPSFRRLCLYACIWVTVVILLLVPAVIFLALKPFNRALSHERAYFDEISRLDSITSRWQIAHDFPKEYDKLFPPATPAPYNERLTPIIHDVAQLASWNWQKGLDLYENGTAEYPMQQFWIYVAVTYRERGLWEKMSLYTEPGGACVDAPHICNAFNTAFNTLVENYHTHRTERTSRARLRFVDCDVSPIVCDEWGMDPVMLVNVQTGRPCRTLWPSFTQICSVYWRFVELPLKKMPFTITKRIGGNVVPVFPSAEEQVKAMVMWEGSQDAFKYESHEMADNIVEDE